MNDKLQQLVEETYTLVSEEGGIPPDQITTFYNTKMFEINQIVRQLKMRNVPIERIKDGLMRIFNLLNP